MRILFTTFAARSHMYAQVPLAWALRSAGHDVRIAGQPDLADDITRTGLTAVPLGQPLDQAADAATIDDRALEPETAADPHAVDMTTWTEILDIAETSPDRLTPDYTQGVFAAYAPLIFRYFSWEMTDDLVDYARWWQPDLIIWDTLTYAGPIAALASGAAHARLLFGLDLVGGMRRHHLAGLRNRPEVLRDDPMSEWLGWALADHGLSFTEEVVTGQWTIDPVPDSLALPTDGLRVPVRYVPYNGPSVLPEWLLEPPKRPRVCVTFGVSNQEVFGRDRSSVGDIIRTVATLDIEVVAALHPAQVAKLGGDVPDNVRVVNFVPLDALLPTCAAVISHGGAGTSQTALAHGVPQIFLPCMIWDSERKAQRMEEYGAALRVADVDDVSAAELRALLVRILEDPSFAERAARLRDEVIATPAPGDIVPVLERLTALHRRPSPLAVR
ncbi:activator-dependent family glycosyltransferase [Streptomyces kanamyceticus]|uniref:Activator-dependent family glycosyltransferase n=1 Tax=Streptomyces kanamyceticus TaxID=1967 RepID=A0A5J6GK41_STRKN|nr:activator-dependent family glycosyltransferase [Streptomyces kanamyceticus]QEU96270.1 activator-dependent family glycosyltransferase [Streptomyces kanamyceticus]